MTTPLHKLSGSPVSGSKPVDPNPSKRRSRDSEVIQKLRDARSGARQAGPAGVLRDFCADLDHLKDQLSIAIGHPGKHQEWAALLDTVRNSVPPEHRSLGLAFTKALALADESAAKGDQANYVLGLRRLWTAFSMLQLTLSI